jgi:hypothetical protein
MEPENLSLCSQEPVTAHCSEPDESSPHSYTLFVYIHFSIHVAVFGLSQPKRQLNLFLKQEVSKVLRKVVMPPLHYTVSQPRNLRLES